MATYLIRRAVQGFVVLVLATFMIYSILLITPGGIRDKLNQLKQITDPRLRPSEQFIKQEEKRYGLDKPYPLSYLIWLFDPDRTKLVETYVGGELTEAKEVPAGTLWFLPIRGSGIITGDFGNS